MFICYVHVNIVKLSRHENVRDINLFNKLIVVKGFRLIIPKIITINRAYSIELKRLENNTTTFTVFLACFSCQLDTPLSLTRYSFMRISISPLCRSDLDTILTGLCQIKKTVVSLCFESERGRNCDVGRNGNVLVLFIALIFLRALRFFNFTCALIVQFQISSLSFRGFQSTPRFARG